MMPVANHVPIPFFERIPIRARLAIRRACDLASLPNQNPEAVYSILCADLKLIDVEQPDRTEFAAWFDCVKAEAAMESAALSSFIKDLGSKRPHRFTVVDERQPADVVSSIEHAHAVVRAADALFKAKLAAGYSPISAELDDTVIQDALTELLDDSAVATLMDIDTRRGHRLMELLLGLPDEDGAIEEKIVNCLTLYMQAELCALFAARAPDS